MRIRASIIFNSFIRRIDIEIPNVFVEIKSTIAFLVLIGLDKILAYNELQHLYRIEYEMENLRIA